MELRKLPLLRVAKLMRNSNKESVAMNRSNRITKPAAKSRAISVRICSTDLSATLELAHRQKHPNLPSSIPSVGKERLRPLSKLCSHLTTQLLVNLRWLVMKEAKIVNLMYMSST